jgi:hypothetical protein
VPDLRPCSLARAEDELVEELDREQDRDEAGDSAPAAREGLAGRPREAHVPISTRFAGCSRGETKPRTYVRKDDRMPGKRASVKNEKQYEALKDKGMSKERAAKIANSPGASSRGGKKSHSASSRSSSSQGGTTAQKKAAGRKGGKATARKS